MQFTEVILNYEISVEISEKFLVYTDINTLNSVERLSLLIKRVNLLYQNYSDSTLDKTNTTRSE